MGREEGRILKEPWPWVGLGTVRCACTTLAATPGDVPLSLKLQIELVYDPGCPNVDLAREILGEVCRDAGVPAVWTEWNSEDPDCPPHAINLGSPTVLVNGEDVAPGPHPWAERVDGDPPRSRVYRDGDSIVRAPPKRRVQDAVDEAMQPDVG